MGKVTYVHIWNLEPLGILRLAIGRGLGLYFGKLFFIIATVWTLLSCPECEVVLGLVHDVRWALVVFVFGCLEGF